MGWDIITQLLQIVLRGLNHGTWEDTVENVRHIWSAQLINQSSRMYIKKEWKTLTDDNSPTAHQLMNERCGTTM